MRLFEHKKISSSRLSESLSMPRMNKQEFLRKQFFKNPENEFNRLFPQMNENLDSPCKIEDVASVVLMIDDRTPTKKNIGFTVTFQDSLSPLPKEGILNHPMGEIEYSIWHKILTLKPR